jgi:hypothetical protein
MQYVDDRYRLRVQLDTQDCKLPADEVTRMQRRLEPLGEAVRAFANSELAVKVIHHPRSKAYHVEGRLKVPGASFQSGDWDADAYPAFERCIHKLGLKVGDYREHPNGRAEAAARRAGALDREVVAPEEPQAGGPLAAAVRAGDYKAFRTRLANFEEWLRNRVGRWVQRYPQVQAQLGKQLLLGDLLEEVYLNAFERYGHWRAEVPFSEWLEDLIDPSLRAMLRHPAEEQENASMARTLRETPL